MEESKEVNINIIYHDENLKYENREIYHDCRRFERKTNGTVILTYNWINLELILKTIKNKNAKCKFILIINGSSAENIITLLNKNANYISLFLKICIYTKNPKLYENIKKKKPEFYEVIYEGKEIIEIIKNTFNNYKGKNRKFYNNILTNFDSYKDKDIILHKYLSNDYGKISRDKTNAFLSNINEIINKNNEFRNKIKNEDLKWFEEILNLINNKEYEKAISCYLKDMNLHQSLNKLLMKKDRIIFEKIGYFASNLMYSFAQYGQKRGTGVTYATTFFKGKLLNILNILEFLKNKGTLITFPYFFNFTINKEFAELTSKRYYYDGKKNDNELYSVMMKFDYLHDDGYEPSIFQLKYLMQYPEEEDYILLPFTFLKITKVKIDSSKFIADIDFSIVGKLNILENDIRNGKNLQFDNENHLMIIK